MKVIIYSDLHICKSSSVMMGYNEGSTISKRSEAILDFRDWLIKLADNLSITTIIDAGDLIDSDLLSAEDVHVLSRYINNTPKHIKEYHISGNHPENGLFSSVELSSIHENHVVYKEISEITDHNIIMVPHGFIEDFLKTWDNSRKAVIITHEFVVSSTSQIFGVKNYLPELTKLDKSIIFNGHIHKAGNLSKNVVNIGNSVGKSFSDNYDNSYPSVIVLDTETFEFSRVIYEGSPLFITIDGSTDKKFDTERIDKELETAYKKSYHGQRYLKFTNYAPTEESAVISMDDMDNSIIVSYLTPELSEYESKSLKSEELTMDNSLMLVYDFYQSINKNHPEEIIKSILGYESESGDNE